MKDISSQKIIKDPKKDKPHKKNRAKGGKLVKKILLGLGRVLVTLFLVGVITGSIVVTALTVYVMKFVDPDVGIDLRTLSSGSSTTVYDDKGSKIQTLDNGENREWVSIDKIPLHVKEAFIYTEDQRFLEHDGVDWKRTFGAFVNMFIDIYGFKQGGSTITQQLIKTLTGENEDKIERKVQEIFRAINLEKKYSKDEILEAYLNEIPLNRNTYGIQAASKLYFNKDVSKLTVLEASALAVMTRNPTRYDPINNPENNKDRREYTLKQLYLNKTIDETEYDKLLDTDLKTDYTKPNSSGNKVYQSYFIDNLINDVVADLMKENGWTKQHAETMLYSGGYKIYSTMNKSIQSTLEAKFKKSSTFSGSTQKDPPQSAMVIMDHYGEIKGVVGGRGEKEGNRIWNRATQSIRSPGSSIKPLAVYAPAIEKDLITYSTMVKDSPILTTIGGKKRYWPNNYTLKSYGTLPIEQAVQRSLNTIPVKLCQELTPKRSFDFLVDKLGITTLTESVKDNGVTKTDISLGGLSMGDFVYGTKLSELTAAYQIFANGGVYTPPRSYTKVIDSQGEVIVSKENPVTTRVISEATAGVMNKLLQRVVEGPYGTGTLAKLSKFTVIGKTGTSEGSKDLAFVGITPYYIGGVWIGYDKQKSLDNSGTYKPTQVWKNVMVDIHKGLESKSFEISDKVKKLQYCRITGLIARSGCPKATGYYKADNIPATCSGNH
jgi:penicillin-binding protein 1A